MLKQKLGSLILILAVILTTIGFLGYLGTGSIKEYFYSAKAAVSDNFSGYAWSENIGWISFNNTSGGGGTSYGVKTDLGNGDFSGYAWSEHIGWISFNRADTGNPPSAPFNGGNGTIAKYNVLTREITGWARVLANGGGWDGWIRFCDTSVAKCSTANRIAKIDTNGDLQGWAWSDAVVGWISLNCANQGNCGVSNYKVMAVVNQAPSTSNLLVTQPNYCKSGPAATFNWSFSDPDPGNTQSAYQVQVATNSGFSGPGTVVDSNKVSSASNSYATGSGKLVYNSTYYWRVRVWDNYDLVSAWASGSNFTTPKHVYPTVNFKASPLSPSVNETVQFTDLTTGGATINGWTWNIQDATYQDGTNANSQNPKVKFTVTGTKTITLVAKDVDNYQCSNADTASSLQNLNIRLPLPGWKEVAP